MINDIYNEMKERMTKAVEALKKEFASIRAGRASASLLDRITVDYYGVPTPIPQMASVTAPEARLLVIQPWDKNMISEIEKAIMKSDLGITPNSDGSVIRLAFPQLTQERRNELVKIVKKKGEEAKVAVRNIRRYGNEMVKELEKANEISEDESRRAQEEIQKITDGFIKNIDQIVIKKEQEIMEI
ncbi:ribosome recycling factor [Anaerobranca californiensis DSM 14826]|jgi:ribosome recycling factor|uniref:Ribosome-recycling factor n=1 Tax=Anaerobranca californiensis DSM 14826 TaxID=1120989 RepID=A0A1M6KG45_9FIRM|nr:ribosome recycling factor [Anaerobranca californiensis]SHJ57842.1 ribosome recycling factor [Anaerobranca californiensis DSM 14826]